MVKERKFTTLLEMSKYYNVKKATMIYYNNLGFFTPAMMIGRMAIFDEDEFKKKWIKLQKLRKKNTLSEIREIFAKENVNTKK